MKTLFTISFVLLCGYYAKSQDNKKIQEDKQDSVYCVVVKDGLTVLTNSSGRIMTADVYLSDGTRISPRGNLTKKDGTQTIMKEGECTNTMAEPMKEGFDNRRRKGQGYK